MRGDPEVETCPAIVPAGRSPAAVAWCASTLWSHGLLKDFKKPDCCVAGVLVCVDRREGATNGS